LHSPKNAYIVHSLSEALEKAKDLEEEEIFICGGAEIYKQAVELSDRIYLTIIHKHIEGDTYFPEYSQFTKTIKKTTFNCDGITVDFLTLEK
jgi:dihydrofolate reductase